MGSKSFNDWQRGAAGGAWVAALSGKIIFFYRYPCTSEALKHLYGMQWRLHRKMKSLISRQSNLHWDSFKVFNVHGG
jgi:hypothetical protein